jgi:purine-cytosine permease-like protein
MAVPYLLTAVGGLVVAADLDIYSSGLNLLSMGIKLERYKTVLIDGVLMILGAIYVMLIAQEFLGPFESFLQLLADGLTAWAAVFLVDMLRRKRYDPVSLADTSPASGYFYQGGFNWAGLLSWLIGLLAGLAFTASPFFNGPFAIGIFANSSLGFLIGFIVSAVLYAVLMPFVSPVKQKAVE